MMKVALALIAIAAFATAVPSEFTEEAPMLDLAQMEGEVKSDINAMQKRGATEADCKDLAKTSCLEVRREVSTNQRVINKLKTGRHCIHLGQGTVRKTTLHWQKTKKTHHSMRIKVTHALRTRVHTSAQRFSSLKRGHCGFIFQRELPRRPPQVQARRQDGALLEGPCFRGLEGCSPCPRDCSPHGAQVPLLHQAYRG